MSSGEVLTARDVAYGAPAAATPAVQRVHEAPSRAATVAETERAYRTAAARLGGTLAAARTTLATVEAAARNVYETAELHRIASATSGPVAIGADGEPLPDARPLELAAGALLRAAAAFPTASKET